MITVRITNLERVRAKCSPRLFTAALANLLRDAAVLAEREARMGAPRDTGALARSITHEARPTYAATFTTLSYARAMEEGRRAGAAMPPPKALEGWAARHGIRGRGAAFVIARAIARRGIKGRFFMRNAAAKVRRALPGLAEKAGRDIAQEWGR